MTKIDGYLTTDEVAELHGVSRGNVIHWITAGDLQAVKVNQIWLIKKEDAENYERRPIPGRPKKNEK